MAFDFVRSWFLSQRKYKKKKRREESLRPGLQHHHRHGTELFVQESSFSSRVSLSLSSLPPSSLLGRNQSHSWQMKPIITSSVRRKEEEQKRDQCDTDINSTRRDLTQFYCYLCLLLLYYHWCCCRERRKWWLCFKLCVVSFNETTRWEVKERERKKERQEMMILYCIRQTVQNTLSSTTSFPCYANDDDVKRDFLRRGGEDVREDVRLSERRTFSCLILWPKG